MCERTKKENPLNLPAHMDNLHVADDLFDVQPYFCSNLEIFLCVIWILFQILIYVLKHVG